MEVVDIKRLVFEGINMLIRTQFLKKRERQRAETKKSCLQRKIRQKGSMPREPEEVHQENMMASVYGLAFHTKDRMYIVDSGASIHIIGISSSSSKRRQYGSLNIFWTFRPRMEVRSQHYQDKSPYLRACHSSLSSFSRRLSSSVIARTALQRTRVFLLVVVRRDSQMIKRE